jgi:hypothetical protein
MYSRSTFGIHGTISTVLAAFIVAFNGLALDRAHLTSAPAGTIEIGELTPLDALPQIATLDEIVVSAAREV